MCVREKESHRTNMLLSFSTAHTHSPSFLAQVEVGTSSPEEAAGTCGEFPPAGHPVPGETPQWAEPCVAEAAAAASACLGVWPSQGEGEIPLGPAWGLGALETQMPAQVVTINPNNSIQTLILH